MNGRRLVSRLARVAMAVSVPLLLLAGCGTTTAKSYRHTVSYSVLSTGSVSQGQMRVSYTDSSGTVLDVDSASAPWTQSVTFDHQVPTVVLTGIASGGLGGLECIITFDGKTVSQHSGAGVASCSYNLPTG